MRHRRIVLPALALLAVVIGCSYSAAWAATSSTT